MTKSKALAIIRKAIEAKGTEQTIVLYYDVFKYRLDMLKYWVKNKKRVAYIHDKQKYLCLKMTLQALLEVVEKEGVTANIGDDEHFLTACVVCREIEKDIETFTRINHLYGAYIKESMNDLNKYYEDNKKAIDAILGA